ncbi:MAG: 1-deoxy-D-xylulose-5-phosphate synthase [Candidatus Chisholmbacteria bacterium]|nr:1-deoxy-D-xylulose-5-phosphate synthase [Candidatus Chisholmbacteria bacterium]
MRGAFVEELTRLAAYDKRVVVLTGDLGYTVLEKFHDLFPSRFYNVGVAEQNMVGVATGLAEAGYIPFVYSIATFASLRAYEFIRNGPVWHHLPVRIVGTGGGFEYGKEGLSHYALEDIGMMRMQPHLMVLSPADWQQAQTMLWKTWHLPQPIYYRVSKYETEPVPNLNGEFEVGRLQLIREGEKVLVLAMGDLARQAWYGAMKLKRENIAAGVGVVASVSPPPTKQLRELVKQFRLIVTLEAHYTTGGIGSLVAETIAETPARCRLIRLGLTRLPRIAIGNEEYMWHKHNFGVNDLVEVVTRWAKDAD